MMPVSLAWIAVAAAQMTLAPQLPSSHASRDTLAVPYIAQPVHLCGGAAMAMIERFWGRRGVYASDFAHLVRKDLNGIVTTDLANAARERGWNPRLVYGAPTVRDLLENGIPVMALIEVAPGRNHYVVLLSWSDDTVVFHDPAIAPSRSQATARFVAQWEKTDRWAMTVLPTEAFSTDATSQPRSKQNSGSRTPAASPVGLCHQTIRHAYQQLEAGHDESAASLLRSVLTPCADTTYVRRALAGVRFRQKRWSAAAHLAAAHVADNPDDHHAWSLLGASRFLSGDEDAALHAWNTIGEPRIDLVGIEGLKGTRFRAVADALGFEPGDTLRMTNLDHARRRLAQVPSVLASRVRYRPVGNGLSEIRARVVEREWSGGSLWAIGRTVTRSLVREEVSVDLISPTGGGERLSAAWTWPSARRRLRLALDVPAPLGLLGTLHMSGQLGRETFASAGGTPEVEERRTAEVAYADWLSPRIHMRVGGGMDRWEGIGDYGVARLAGSWHPRDERVALSAGTALWASASGAPGFARFSLRADWRSHAGPSQTLLTGRIGLDHSTSAAPRMEWPSAGIRREGAAALRAHRLIRDDVVSGSTIGRTLLHGGVAADRWLTRIGFVQIGGGIFADAAAVWHGHRSRGSPYRLDAGAGIRIGSGFGSSVLRVDFAQALLDSGRVVSLSLSTPWPN